MENTRINLFDLTFDQLKDWLKTLDEPVFQTELLSQWLFRKMAAGFNEMADLRPSLKSKLESLASLTTLKVLEDKTSSDGQTRKLLLQTEDNQTLETALMAFRKNGASRERRTICVSSQIGCAVGCGFCATGQQGFKRNLRPGEILEQVLFFARDLRDRPSGTKKPPFWPYITHIVFMGMGEPLANFENVCQAIRILNSPKGLNLGVRQITLSTAGLAPQIRQLAEDTLQFELAVSLHAAKDRLRDDLVPLNRKYPISDLLDACRFYFEKTGRKPFFEYALFSGVNDSPEQAQDLVRLLGDFKCSINLIVGNPTPDASFQPSSMEQALAFQKVLMTGGLRTMIRNSKGSDIEAGCGQLRSRWLKENFSNG